MVGIIVRVGRDGLPVPFGRPLEIRLLLAQEHRVESGDLGELGRVVAAGEEMSQMLELLLVAILSASMLSGSRSRTTSICMTAVFVSFSPYW